MRTRISVILFTAIIGVLLVAAVQPSLALADEATPPAEETQPPPPTPVPEEVEETEQAPEQEGQAEEPTAEPAEAPTEEPTAEAAEAATEELDLPEILEQAPEGTEVVVLDENGEPLALATEEAAEAMLVGDPIWCNETDAPIAGAGSCTASYASLQALIDDINNAVISEPADNGIIWIMQGNDTSAAAITIDGSSLGTWATYRLSLYGGWDGGAAGNTPGTSVFDQSLSLVNWQNDVTLNDIIFQDADDSFASLEVETSGDIDVDEVQVLSNDTGSGAYLDTCDYNSGTGLCAGTGDVTVTNSTFDSNNFNGLVTDSGGDTDLVNVQANNNNADGAYITGADDDGTGDVTIQNSQFNGNANGTGLDVYSDGNISLNNVAAGLDLVSLRNNFTGIQLDATAGTGTISVLNSEASDNDGTGLHATSYGDITLTTFTADDNAANGAYLFAYDTANIFVDTNSHFGTNGNYGLFAKTFAGDITLDHIDVDGNSGHGAFLKTYDGGNVTVDTSSFNNNTLSGLVVVSSGQVDLNNVTADNNGKHGVEVYSMYTYTCHGENDITVNVDAGTFSNNVFYGLYVAPGASGTLFFVNPATFLPANGSGDYNLVLENPDCSKKSTAPSKPLKIVDVPFSDGPFVEQECDLYSGTVLVLPNGSSVKVGCPYSGETQLEGLDQVNLPGPLGAGGTFQLGISVKFTQAGLPVEKLTEGGLLTLSFEIPEGARGRRYSILFWDPSANGGAGAWIQLPPFEYGTSFKLNPDDPADGRMILSGVRQQGNTVVATVNFPGTFILVSE